MEFDEFEALVQEARGGRAGQSLPEGFELFDSLRASESDLQRVEAALEVELPDKYKQFMLQYGCGVFMFLELLPAIAEDGYAEDLLSVNRSDFMDPGFVAVAPVGTGDWWGFTVVDGRCGDTVYFWFHDERKIEASSDDFLDFVARRGLRAGE